MPMSEKSSREQEHNLLHQDWKTIIVNTKKSKSKEENSKESNYKVKKVNIENKLDKKIDEGVVKHDKYNSELIKNLKNYRSYNNLTQKQLAQKLNINPKLISDIECNKGIYDHRINNKLKRLFTK
jgi:ribosome-binding protein aMBF1 (putative translation factor)